MLEGFLVFFVCLGALLWYLVKEYDREEEVDDASGMEEQQKGGRRRNRRKHGGCRRESVGTR